MKIRVLLLAVLLLFSTSQALAQAPPSAEYVMLADDSAYDFEAVPPPEKHPKWKSFKSKVGKFVNSPTVGKATHILVVTLQAGVAVMTIMTLRSSSTVKVLR